MIELTCESCGVTFQRAPSHVKKRAFCSRACYEALGRRKEQPAHRRMVKVDEHPIATGGGLISEQRLVLFDKIGYGPHLCHWCSTPINWRPGSRTSVGAIVADHVDENPYNNDPANLVESCQSCNTWRNRTDRIGDDEPVVMKWSKAKGTTRHRGVASSCAICGAAFVKAASEKRPGRGLYCSRSCARRAPKAG